MERILEYKFFLEKSSFLFTENLYSNLNPPSISVENLINTINKDIDLNEWYNLEKDIELLSDYFRSKGDLSIIYVKYIFADILKRLLDKNHFDDKIEIKEHVENIFNCSSILQLKEIVQSVLKRINALTAEVNEESRRWLIDDVLNIIESEHMKDIGLDYIAEKISISSSYLSFIFRKETGHNLVKYINQFRLEKSKVLLRETNFKIVDVGKKVGFLNQSYFCLMFKNYYGLTPGDFRERVKLSDKTSSGS
jgi:two-component system response regulator YesN